MKWSIGRIIRASKMENANAQERAEEELREQWLWFEVTLSSIGDGVIATDTNGSINFLNPAAESLTGWRLEEALGQPLEHVFRIVNAETRRQAENPAMRALREGRISGLANNTILIAKDGKEISIDDSGAPIKDGNGGLLGAVLVFHDVTERRSSDEARALLAAIVNSSEDAIISKNLDGVIKSWNVAAERLFEYTAAEAIGQHITIIIPKERIEEERLILNRLRRGERIEHYETVRVSKSGKRLDISLAISPIRDKNGRVIGASKIARNITERRNAEETQDLLAGIVNSSDDAIISKSLEGIIQSWNAAAERMFEYSADEAIGQSITIIIPPERLDEEHIILSELRAGRRIDHFETVRVSKNGRLIDISLSVSPIWDAAGHVIGVSKIARDITARKRAEEALRQQRELLEVTLSSIGDAVIATDTKGAITFINPVAQSLTGWDREEARGQPLQNVFRVINEQTRNPVENPALRAITEGVIVGLANHTVLIASDGTEIFVDDSGAPIKDVDGKVLGAVLVFRDVADRRRTENERMQLFAKEAAARDRAERVSRAKDEFVAMISHEIRSPLTAILGWCHMLRQGGLEQSVADRALETIERNARTQVQLIEDLIDISRVTTGKLRLQIRPLEIKKVLKAALDSIRPAADAKSIKVDSHVKEEAILIAGDPDRLQQVFFNLLSNAVKFTPANGRVDVTLEHLGSNIQITVTDSGAGIRSDFLPYVFDRFTQADTTTARKHGGLGLGLAIVRHLVELHGGSVEAESAGEGKGASFTVRLPLRPLSQDTDDLEPTDAVATAPGISAESRMLEGIRILLVEDEAETRDLLVSMLTARGADVKACASAAEALETLEHWRPSVLVSDIGMPDEDGYSLIKKIRKLGSEQRNIPAVALTAYARAEDRMRVLASGFQMHVAKPVEALELMVVIASLAGRGATIV